MSKTNIKEFLKALQSTTESLTCRVCSQLCQNPVTLSVCFHTICGEHYNSSLKSCPECNIELNNCPTFTNDYQVSAIRSLEQLQDIFKGYNVDKNDKPKKKRNTEHKAEKVDETAPKVPAKDKQSSTSEVAEVEPIPPVSALSKSLKSLEKKNVKGETALHVACRQGKYEDILTLLAKGANANTKDHAGWTPLHEVVQNGRLDLVKLLLRHSAFINIPGAGNESPLHEAVRYGFSNIVEELVKHGADINAWNAKGETPLQLASAEMKETIEKCTKLVIIPQTMNLIEESQSNFDEIYLYCTIKNKTLEAKLKQLTRHFKELNFKKSKIPKHTTHIIVGTDDKGVSLPSFEILEGIAKGLWILSPEWIINSTTTQLEPYEKYEVKGIGTAKGGPKRSRHNKLLQLPGIFNNCHFYLHNFRSKYEVSKHLVLTYSNLSNLIIDCGGIVRKRAPDPEGIPESERLVPYHAKKDGKLKECAHFIIYKDMFEPMYNMSHVKALPLSWLLQCIEKYELIDP